MADCNCTIILSLNKILIFQTLLFLDFWSDVMVTVLSNIITLNYILDSYDVLNESFSLDYYKCDCYNTLFLTLDY